MIKNKFFTGRVFCLGYCILDLTILTKRFPEVGETYYTDSDYTIVAGGKGLNQSITASIHGASSYIISTISRDMFGDTLIETLTNNNVNLDYVIRSNNNSGVAFVNTIKDGNNKIICCPGVNILTPSKFDVNKIDFRDGDILLSTLEFNENYLLDFFKKCKKKGVFIMVDPSMDYEKLNNFDVYKYIDVIKPNELEAKLLLLEQKHSLNEKEMLLKLKELGIKYPMISLGDRGVIYLKDSGEVVKINSLDVNPIDSTGAGDVLLGSMAAALSTNRYGFHEALEYAVVSAGISVTRLGASSSIPSQCEVITKLEGAR